MVKDYQKYYAKDFIKKSERFLEISKQNLEKFPEESTFNAIQSIINANDALTISNLGKKATKDHREALILHKDVIRKIGDSSKLSTIKAALEARDATGYDVKKRFGRKKCEILVKKAERYLFWVKNHI